MALKSTTTPALTIQVSKVGLMLMSSILPLRVFFLSLRSREVEAFLLVLSRAEEVESVESLRSFGRGRVDSSPKTTDSGTMRRVEGSILLDDLVVGCAGESRFGKPLAAAAQESSVDKLALKAASWSAWCDGEIML